MASLMLLSSNAGLHVTEGIVGIMAHKILLIRGGIFEHIRCRCVLYVD